MKKIAVFFIVLIIFVIGIVLAKNIIAKAAIINGVKAITGLDIELGEAKVGILKTFFSLADLKILNPRGFSDKIMADLPEIYASYDLGGFFKGKVHLGDLRINLKQLVVVTNEKGEANIKSLNAFLPKGSGKPPQVQIDNLNLKIGKVVYKNYWLGKAEEREFDININEDFKNITDPNALVGLILVRALSGTDIAGLANINLSGLRDEVSKEVTGQLETVTGQLKEKAQETLNKAEEGLKSILQPEQ